jgi:hypothetical protein
MICTWPGNKSRDENAFRLQLGADLAQNFIGERVVIANGLFHRLDSNRKVTAAQRITQMIFQPFNAVGLLKGVHGKCKPNADAIDDALMADRWARIV